MAKFNEHHDWDDEPDNDFDDYDEPPRNNKPKKSGSVKYLLIGIIVIALAIIGAYGYYDLKLRQTETTKKAVAEINELEQKVQGMFDDSNYKVKKELEDAVQKQVEFSKRLGEAANKADSAIKEISKASTQISDNTERLNSLETTFNSISGTLQELHRTTETLRTNLETITNQQQEITKQQKNLTEQQQDLAREQRNLSANISSVSNTQSSLNKLQSDIERLNTEIIKVRTAGDAAFSNDLKTLRNELGDLKRKVELIQ